MQELKRISAMLLNIIIPLLGITGVIFIGPKLVFFFMPFVIAWFLAMLANPIVNVLEKKISLRRKHGSLLIVVGVLMLIIAAIYAAFRLVFEAADMILARLPAMQLAFSNEIGNITDRLPERSREKALLILDNAGDYAQKVLSGLASPTFEIAGSFIGGIPNALVYTIFTILLSYSFIAGRESIGEYISSHIPKDIKKYGSYLKRDFITVLKGYFAAQFRIMLVIMVISVAGLMIVGTEFAVLLGIGIALLDFLPMLGTGTVLIPWALVKLVNGRLFQGIGLVVLYILTQAVRQLIQPKLVGESVGMPPFLTIFCLYLGFKLKGIGGMLIAVPLGMLVLKLYEYGLFDGIRDNAAALYKELDSFRKKYGIRESEERK